MNIKLLNGDNIELLKTLKDNSVDSIVTDPPYGLSFMGKKWDYDVPSTELWKECLRVLKPGGHLLAFAGTRTQHRMAVRIEDAGFDIRDMIAWVYGSGFPKSHNGEWGGTALKPALEPITVARKPIKGTVADNVLKYGTGALNIDDCRIETDENLGRYSNARTTGTSYVVQTKSGFADNTNGLGRWPANFIHDGSEEVKDILGNQSRFFYCAKASKKDRDSGLGNFELRKAGAMSGAETRPDKPTNHPMRANTHPTVKPTDLMRYLVRLVTPKGGVVLDPFMGSGSTGKACVLEGFDFIGMELDADYFKIAEARINHELKEKKDE